MSKTATKTISPLKLKALVLLIKNGKNTIDDIKDEEYKKAVSTALNE